MENQDRQLIGICGIYCGDCPSYLANRTGDIKELEARAQRTGRTVPEVRCDGCLSDNVAPACQACGHGFRQCAREHGVTWCFKCPDFPCQRSHSFRDIHVENGISHHEHLIDELYYLKDHGPAAWLVKKAGEARCPQCGKSLYWCARTCPDCGAVKR